MAISLNLIAGPALEPITLSLAKQHCRAADDEDEVINLAIGAAREHAEHILGRALITQTWERVLDAFPGEKGIELFMPPVQSVTSVKYVDLAGVQQTLSSGQYALDKDSEPGWVVPAAGFDWPSTYDTINAVRVRYVAGYDNDGVLVPKAIKHALLLGVSEFYENRSASSVEFCSAGAFVNLLQRYRLNLGL
jgi:uncharacterized phiE125 gp8 family phage protein